MNTLYNGIWRELYRSGLLELSNSIDIVKDTHFIQPVFLLKNRINTDLGYPRLITDSRIVYTYPRISSQTFINVINHVIKYPGYFNRLKISYFYQLGIGFERSEVKAAYWRIIASNPFPLPGMVIQQLKTDFLFAKKQILAGYFYEENMRKELRSIACVFSCKTVENSRRLNADFRKKHPKTKWVSIHPNIKGMPTALLYKTQNGVKLVNGISLNQKTGELKPANSNLLKIKSIPRSLPSHYLDRLRSQGVDANYLIIKGTLFVPVKNVNAIQRSYNCKTSEEAIELLYNGHDDIAQHLLFIAQDIFEYQKGEKPKHLFVPKRFIMTHLSSIGFYTMNHPKLEDFSFIRFNEINEEKLKEALLKTKNLYKGIYKVRGIEIDITDRDNLTAQSRWLYCK